MENEHQHPENGYDITPAEAPEAVKATTAFLVVCYPDGRKTAVSDVNLNLELEREATLNDMYDGAGQVQRDIMLMLESNTIASQTVNGMMQAMAQQAEMMRQMKIEQKLAEKGIRVPGR